jgi:hypothetical protein
LDPESLRIPLRVDGMARASTTALPDDVVIDVTDSVRIILIGDTGLVKDKDPKTCSGDDQGFPAQINPELIAAMQASIRGEGADVTVALGDLIYPNGVGCNDGELSDAKTEKIDGLLADYLGEFDTPVLMILGNHDVHGSTKGAQRYEHCLLQYATETDAFIITCFQPEIATQAGDASSTTSSTAARTACTRAGTKVLCGKSAQIGNAWATRHVGRIFTRRPSARSS